MNISLQIVVTDDAYREFVIHMALTHPTLMRERRSIVRGWILLTGFLFLPVMVISRAPIVALTIVAVGGFLAWLAWYRYPTKFAEGQIAIRKEVSKEARLFPRQLTVNENFIAMTGEHTNQEFKWPAIYAWGEGALSLFFCVSPTQGIVVPKASLNADHLHQLRAFTASKLGPPNSFLQPIALKTRSG